MALVALSASVKFTNFTSNSHIENGNKLPYKMSILSIQVFGCHAKAMILNDQSLKPDEASLFTISLLSTIKCYCLPGDKVNRGRQL